MEETNMADVNATDVIKQNIQCLIEQLESGKSEALTTYLTAISRFHHYSFGNVMAIARQRPTASRVAGFQTWKEMGRFVRKGEKGIQILAPIVGKRKDAVTDEEKKMVFGFRAVYVFDVEQTDGQELPEISMAVTGEVGEHFDRLTALVGEQGITLEYDETIGPALGMSYGGKIKLLPGGSKPELFSTLVHELAHEMLHKAERRASTTKTIRETEAEAVAFIVSKAIGLNAGNSSADYIQLYNGDAAVLTESLAAIQHTGAAILAALQGSKGAEAVN
jgi:antirestriction protein ArdC